jgi:hypothetical protein
LYYLLVSIFSCGILGLALFSIMDPFLAGIIIFSIVAGCLFRGLYLLVDIHKRLATIVPKRDKVQEAFDTYIKEKNS